MQLLCKTADVRIRTHSDSMDTNPRRFGTQKEGEQVRKYESEREREMGAGRGGQAKYKYQREKWKQRAQTSAMPEGRGWQAGEK